MVKYTSEEFNVKSSRKKEGTYKMALRMVEILLKQLNTQG